LRSDEAGAAALGPKRALAGAETGGGDARTAPVAGEAWTEPASEVRAVDGIPADTGAVAAARAAVGATLIAPETASAATPSKVKVWVAAGAAGAWRVGAGAEKVGVALEATSAADAAGAGPRSKFSPAPVSPVGADVADVGVCGGIAAVNAKDD
jgi:hypothetical protein